MRTRSWYLGIVIISALIVAVESVAVEGALNIAIIDVFIVASIPSIIGGLILIALQPRPSIKFVRDLGKKDWKFLIVLSVVASVGVFMWYDAVGRIGAGKEAILGGGSSEVLFVLLLSAIFLSERLKRLEIVGSIMVLIGVFLVLVRSDTLSLDFNIGEAEAITSSFLLGTSAVMSTKLLRVHSAAPLSAIELIISGIILLAFGIAMGANLTVDLIGWSILLAIGIFPAVGILTYFIGLKGVGASITSVLFALNGVMTVIVQLIILAIYPDAEILPPENLALALVGGFIAFGGVYLINKRPSPKVPASGGHKI